MTLSFWLRDYLYIPLGGNRGPRMADLGQHPHHHADRRPVARGGVDVRDLGRSTTGSARSSADSAAAPGWRAGLPAEPVRAGVALSPGSLTFQLVCVGWLLFRADTLGASGRCSAVCRRLGVPSPLVTPLAVLAIAAGIASQYLPDDRLDRVQGSSPTAAPWCRGAYLAWCFWPSPPWDPRAWPPSSTTASEHGPPHAAPTQPPDARARPRRSDPLRRSPGAIETARSCRRRPGSPFAACWERCHSAGSLDPDAVHRPGLLRGLALLDAPSLQRSATESPARAPGGRSRWTWSARSPHSAAASGSPTWWAGPTTRWAGRRGGPHPGRGRRRQPRPAAPARPHGHRPTDRGRHPHHDHHGAHLSTTTRPRPTRCGCWCRGLDRARPRAAPGEPTWRPPGWPPPPSTAGRTPACPGPTTSTGPPSSGWTWPTTIRNLVVVMIGANDPQSLVGADGSTAYGSPGLERRLRAAGRRASSTRPNAAGAHVLWVGMPPMAEPDLNGEMQAINRWCRCQIVPGRHGPPTSPPPPCWATARGTSPPTFPKPSGVELNIRTPDGIHLSPGGGERLSQAVIASHALAAPRRPSGLIPTAPAARFRPAARGRGGGPRRVPERRRASMS